MTVEATSTITLPASSVAFQLAKAKGCLATNILGGELGISCYEVTYTNITHDMEKGARIVWVVSNRGCGAHIKNDLFFEIRNCEISWAWEKLYTSIVLTLKILLVNLYTYPKCVFS